MSSLNLYAEHRRFPLHAEPFIVEPNAIEHLWVADLSEAPGGVSLRLEGSTAMLHIDGPIAHRADFFWTGYDAIVACFQAAIECDALRAVVLVIDAPGGVSAGLFETVQRMLQAKQRAGKRVVAFTSSRACGAAYALATVADQIVVSERGSVGSLACFRAIYEPVREHERLGIATKFLVSRGAVDRVARTFVGNTTEPTQRIVDVIAERMARLVANERHLSLDAVQQLGFQAYTGSAAVEVGLADCVGTRSTAISLAEQRKEEPLRSAPSSGQCLGLLSGEALLAQRQQRARQRTRRAYRGWVAGARRTRAHSRFQFHTKRLFRGVSRS